MSGVIDLRFNLDKKGVTESPTVLAVKITADHHAVHGPRGQEVPSRGVHISELPHVLPRVAGRKVNA